jgi:AcrR family transcriptional regulator
MYVCQAEKDKLVKKNLKVEQGKATTQHILDVAQQLFSEEGYANVSTTEIVKAVGVTRGALYHHFNGKEALFRAVFEKVQSDIGQYILESIASIDDDWQRLIVGCRAFIEASSHTSLQQILQIDAPVVLGRQTWRELDDQYTTSLLREQLQDLIDKGIIQSIPVDAVSHLLAGAMNEAVLWISESDDRERAIGESMEMLILMLASLRR